MYKNFGVNLRRYRELRGLSQKELANLLTKETGISFNHRHISNYENTEIFPKPQVIPYMAKVLEVSTDNLFGVKTKDMKETDISQIIGVKRPELNGLSKADLKSTFENYLNYLDELIRANVFYTEKARRFEEKARECEEQLTELKDKLKSAP